MSEQDQYALIPHQPGVSVEGIDTAAYVGEVEIRENCVGPTIEMEVDGEEIVRTYRGDDFVSYHHDAWDLLKPEDEDLSPGVYELGEISAVESFRDEELPDPELGKSSDEMEVMADGGWVSSFRVLEEDPEAVESYSRGYDVRFHETEGYTVVTGPRDQLSHFFQDERQNLGRELDEGEFFRKTSYDSKDELSGQLLEDDSVATAE
jgi:hypothetical protein